MILLFLFIIFLNTNFSSENKSSPLLSLLNEFKEPNTKINQAFKYRLEEINKNSENTRTQLLDQEKKYEREAYCSYFNILNTNLTINKLAESILKKWNSTFKYIEEELKYSYKSENYDKNRNIYHNLHFELDNFDQLHKKQIFTDNHTSKFIIQFDKAIFLGDLLDRDIDLNYEDKEFLLLKYHYFMQYYVIKQSHHKKKLQENTLSFKEIDHLYTLGNHDCGNMIIGDFHKIIPLKEFEITLGIHMSSLYKKIDEINRFLTPSEIVFTAKKSQHAYVLSHSGGMILLRDDTKKTEQEYDDFKITTYHYNLSNYTEDITQSKKFETLEPEAQSFITKLHTIMNETSKELTKDPKKIYYANVYIWCDYFTGVNREDRCCKSINEGRYDIMNVESTNILPILCNIITKNYSLNIDSISIFRGHEHEGSKLEQYFKNNFPVYKIVQDNKNCFYYLMCVNFDNNYSWMKNLLMITEPPTIQEYIDRAPDKNTTIHAFETINKIRIKCEDPNKDPNEEDPNEEDPNNKIIIEDPLNNIENHFLLKTINHNTEMESNGIEEKDRYFFPYFIITSGVLLPFLYLNIEQLGIKNITAGIATSLLITCLNKKFNNKKIPEIKYIYLILPSIMILLFIRLTNKNTIHLLMQSILLNASRNNFLLLCEQIKKLNFNKNHYKELSIK